jgi:hypothetical protein
MEFLWTNIDVFQKCIKDDEMAEATNLLKIIFTQYIRYAFEKIFELEKIGSLNNDSLEFKINKSELAGLIAILIESNILELPKTGGRYDFFEKYFRWKDNSGQSQKMNNMKGDIAKIRSQDSINKRTKGALDIFGKLEDGYNSL